MTIEEWQKALMSIKDFVGTFSISFSGGEPFIKPGFLDLMAFCHENGIHAGVTTNGSALTKKNAAKLVAAQPWNLNVSVDAPFAELHDYLRGWPGLFQKLSDGINTSATSETRPGSIFRSSSSRRSARRTTSTCRTWFSGSKRSAPRLSTSSRWTDGPRRRTTSSGSKQDEHAELQQVVDTMLELKRQGEPIMNSELVISLLVRHFREESAPPEAMPCRVGMRDFFIRTNGDVEVCFFYPPIGNIKENSAREIWYSPKAQEIRRQTVECDRLCLYTCLSQKTLTDKVKMGLTILTHQNRKKPTEELAETIMPAGSAT